MLPSPFNLLSLVLICTVATTVGSAPFEPEVDLSLTEKWRWHELEPLSGFILDRGIEDHDGNLVFTGKDSLILYDGYTTQEIAYPVNEEDFDAYDMLMSENGYLYLNSTHGVFAWRDARWTQLLEHRMQISDNRPHFARNGRGLELLSVSSGVYRIEGLELTRLPEFPDELSTIAFDRKNRLWMIVARDREVRVTQFEDDQIKRPYTFKSSVLDFNGNIFPAIIASPVSDEVWSVNWLPSHPAFRYDESTQEWVPHDLTPLTGNNRHTYGYHFSETDMAIFSKTSILIKHHENWHSIEYPEFDFPANNPFFILRANGNLVLGGRGEKIYEIDYNSREQDSYHGLHFQCDVGGRNRWFISIEGHIIEQDTVYDTWVHHTENVIDTPLSLLKSDDDTIWASGSHGGVAAIAYYNGREWKRELLPRLNSMISHLSSRQLPNGDIVFGSGEDDPHQPNGGLVIFRPTNSGYDSHYVGPPSVPYRPVGMAVGKEGQIWFAGRYLNMTSSLGAAGSLQMAEGFNQEMWFDHISEDNHGDIWLALWERGIFSFDGATWSHHYESDKVASSQVTFILKDQHRTNTVWFATDRGVSRFDGELWYPQAIPPELRFDREGGTLRQSSDGSIWINVATRNWFFRKTTSFYITKRLHDTFKTVRYHPDEAPPVVRISADELAATATAPANVLISWQGVDKWSNTPVSKLKYSFRLNDDPWSAFSEGNSHVFLDMSAGHHQFEVRALDLDGNLSATAATVAFTVNHALWQRPWFIAAMFLILATIIGLVLLLFRQRIRHLVQLEEFKLQFFTNISHELRTPLTVILGPLESQLAKLPASWDRKPLEIAYKNAKRTLNLIDQLLDFRSAATGNIKISLAQSDLAATVREVLHLLKPLADERSQSLEFVCRVDRCVVWFDAEVIEKILNNLVSNAVKYTQLHGRITVHFRTYPGPEITRIELIVEDNGSGISINHIDDIFEVFVRARTAKQGRVRGSGIGLAYTKKLIETCDGTITVDSPVVIVDGRKQGTRFTVSLPLRTAESPPATALPDATPSSLDLEAASPEEADPRPLVLIVEDDDEIREFLLTELTESYQVSSAPNGATALEFAITRIPDLIVSDVMMPEVDGKELCRRIKANELTSHIPVIMLTALKSEQHELEGLEIGADDYLSKPIRLSILKKRIHNLLESRQKLQTRFQQQKTQAIVVAEEITTNPVDEAFMNKAVTLVEEHLEDALFDVEAFAHKMFMSRMTLYRKLKAITGDSPSTFIRSIRMNKAAALLATKEYNVSETADLVGIPDLSSFSTAFKKHFNVSPSQYATRHDSRN